MSAVSVLVFPKFRKAAEGIAAWLSGKRYHALFLNLPEDLTRFAKDYRGERISLEELWRDYGYLTGLSRPFINALRYRMDPVLEALTSLTS